MIILTLLWILYGTCKAITDGRLFGEKVIRPFLSKYDQRWPDWYDGKRGLLTMKVNQGYPWSCDYWHFFDTMRNLTAISAMIIAPIVLVEYSWWAIILFAWFCYWLPSFQFVYKVILMKEWTFKQYLSNILIFWN